MYFLSLVPKGFANWSRGAEPRCIGFSTESFRPEQLTEADTEDGYFTYAVLERYEQGLWQMGEVVEWWEFKDGKWGQIERPLGMERIVSWAIN